MVPIYGDKFPNFFSMKRKYIGQFIQNQEVNQTAEPDASSAQDLTTEEMEIIKGQQLSAPANMLTSEKMQSIRGKGRGRRREYERSFGRRNRTRRDRERRREEIFRDLRTVKRYGIGGGKIVGGSILIAGGVMKGWNPTGWIAIGGGIVSISRGLGYLWG